jgi:F0F1-type ATP synthase membrane subunit b/b'
MRRARLAIILGLALAPFALPQEHAAGSEAAAEAGDPWIVWKWVNFAILAAGLGYLIAKNAPAYFQSRTDEIRKSLDEAAREAKDAEAKAAGIELRLSGLQNEIEDLRKSARAEMASEAERIRTETERHLRRIQEQSAQEIALLTRASRDELRRYSAALALDLAEQRIRSRMTPGAQDGLVDGFLHDLERSAARGRLAR